MHKQIVRLRKKGLDNKSVAEMVGMSATHRSTTWQKYIKGEMEATKPGINPKGD